MEQFELKVNLSTSLIKTINAFGFILLGFTVGITIFAYKLGKPIDWLNTVLLTTWSLLFGFFPGRARFPSLYINEKGILLEDYTFDRSEKKEITWEKISSIQVDKNKIHIKNNIGSSERIKLPMHTKEQIKDLKTYLKEVTPQKEVEYLG